MCVATKLLSLFRFGHARRKQAGSMIVWTTVTLGCLGVGSPLLARIMTVPGPSLTDEDECSFVWTIAIDSEFAFGDLQWFPNTRRQQGEYRQNSVFGSRGRQL